MADCARMPLLLPLLAIVIAGATSAISSLDPHLGMAEKDPERAFRLFLARFGRNYTTRAEHNHRFRIFRANVLAAAERQLLDPTAVHGVTKFSDLTPEEFARQALGLKAPEFLARASSGNAETLPTEGLPTEFDWRDKGAVTEVKNQGMCGSCYAFSAVGAVEGAHFLKTGELLSLSEQQIVDCDHQCDPEYHDVCDSGCNGGLMNNVLTYVEKAGGLVTYKEYPYTARPGACKFDKNKVATTVQKFVQVSTDEGQIKANLVKYGPLAVAINAGWMQSYVHGVSCPLFCDKKALNHGVLLVGYGTHGYSPARLKYKDFLIIKNSWGEEWGEQGYYRVCAGKDECGIDSMVSAVVATDGDTKAVAAAEAKASLDVAFGGVEDGVRVA